MSRGWGDSSCSVPVLRLVQARHNWSNRCRGPRNNVSDVRPTDAAGVKPPSQTLAPVFRGMLRVGVGVCAAIGKNREKSSKFLKTYSKRKGGSFFIISWNVFNICSKNWAG